VDEAKLRSLLAMLEGRGFSRVRQGMVLSSVHRSAGGLLVWVSRPSYPLRVLCSLFGTMNPYAQTIMLRPEGSAGWVEALWRTYIGAIEILITALGSYVHATGNLDNPLLGALDVREQADYGRPVSFIGSDSSLSEKLGPEGHLLIDEGGEPILEGGYGFTCHKVRVYAAGSMDDFVPALRKVFGNDMRLIIFFCELMTAVAGALEVGPAWSGCLIGIPVDNSNAFMALDKCRTRHPMCQYLLGILVRTMAEWRYDQIPFYVSTHDNSLNDDLSREYLLSDKELQKMVDSYTVDKGTWPYRRIDISARFNYLLIP
jgi:hypothetical protein